MRRDSMAIREIADARCAVPPPQSEDRRIDFTSRYAPRDIVTGDFHGVCRLDQDRYGLILADVTAPGMAAALHACHLGRLWERYQGALVQPGAFAMMVNNELVEVSRAASSFVTAVCAVVDVEANEFRFAAAGRPSVLLVHADGSRDQLTSPGDPFGVTADEIYDETRVPVRDGDRLLLSASATRPSGDPKTLEIRVRGGGAHTLSFTIDDALEGLQTPHSE